MKMRVADMEKEAARLRAMQASLATTHVNGPENSNVPSLGDLVQGLEASIEAVPINTSEPTIRATEMEEMDESHIKKNTFFDGWTFNQHW